MLPEDFPNMKGKQREKWIWKVEEVWRAQFRTILFHDGKFIDSDAWGYLALLNIHLAFCSVLCMWAFSSFAQLSYQQAFKEKKQLVGNRRIMYAEFTGRQSVACYLSLEKMEEGASEVYGSVWTSNAVFNQRGQVPSLVLDTSCIFWGVSTWLRNKGTSDSSTVLLTQEHTWEEKRFVSDWRFEGGKWGRNEEGKGLQMHMTLS